MGEAKAAIALTQVYVWLLETPEDDRTPRHDALCDVVKEAIAALTGDATPWICGYHERLAGEPLL